jgi:hypothetical protein
MTPVYTSVIRAFAKLRICKEVLYKICKVSVRPNSHHISGHFSFDQHPYTIRQKLTFYMLLYCRYFAHYILKPQFILKNLRVKISTIVSNIYKVFQSTI